MTEGIAAEIRNSAHLAHTYSTMAVDYEKMAQEFYWRRGQWLERADECRRDGAWWLRRARRLKAFYA